MIRVAGDDLGAFVAARMRADHLPGLSVAVVAGDRVRWLRAFGTADLATGAPARPRTAYPWFSMTKIVTADATRYDHDAIIAAILAAESG